MFHQTHNTFGNRIYNAFLYGDGVTYDNHFHKSYELIYCMRGSLTLCEGDRQILLREGDLYLLFPYKNHAFSVKGKTRIWVGVFSGDYVSKFDALVAKKEPKDAKFRLDAKTDRFLRQTFFCKEKQGIYTLEKEELLALKGNLYLILSSFLENADLVAQSDNRELMMRMIAYIEQNYKEQITLHSAAAELNYHYQYLSRVFSGTMNMNFRTLVNQYRFDHACLLLERGDMTVTEAALEAGFQSVRNFNRIYKEKTGKTPREGKEKA